MGRTTKGKIAKTKNTKTTSKKQPPPPPQKKSRKYAANKKNDSVVKAKGELSVITNTAKRNIWKRGGTRRIKSGALDSVDNEVVDYVRRIAYIAVRSCLSAKRRRITSRDIDFALETIGEAIY